MPLMDLTNLAAAAIGSAVTIVGILAKNKLLISKAHQTNIETELAITKKWEEYASTQEAQVNRLIGRVETLEGESKFWRDKHIESLTNYEELKVKHTTLTARVSILEAENAHLVYLLQTMEEQDEGESPKSKPKQKRKSARRKKS